MEIQSRPKLIQRIILLSLIVVVAELLYLAIRRDMITFNPILVRALEVVFSFVISLLVITVILRLTQNRVFNMFRKEMEIEQRIIISKLYSIALYSIAFLVAFWRAGVSLGNLTLFVGLIATGFAFAIRDLLLSFFAWFIILNKKPFQMGDYIKIGNEMGLVTRIGTFFFTLETGTPGEFIKVPNSLVLTNPIQNKGEERFKEVVKVKLTSMPENMEEKISELGTFLRSRVPDKELVKVRLDADEKNWYLVASYFISFKQEQLKTTVLIEINRIFNQHLHEPIQTKN